MKIEVVAAVATISAEKLQVGDEIELDARARIVGITEEVVDVTSYGSQQYLPGELTMSLLITSAQILGRTA